MSQENNCEYVCSRGILKSCDVKSATPVSSTKEMTNYTVAELKPGATIYICSDAIPTFISECVPNLDHPFILVTGDSDKTIPTDVFTERTFREFMDSPKLIHWFAQNCVLASHPKLSQIPIGLDYHTLANADHEWGYKASPRKQEKLLKSIRATAKPCWERKCEAYANYHFTMETKFANDRKMALEQIPAELVYYEPLKVSRKTTWQNQSEYAFVISPRGNGLDCHRTWEALALGCIPIVKTSLLDPLFKGLPVLIVKEWSDITRELLEETMANYRDCSEMFNMERLKLSYWVNKIRNPPAATHKCVYI